MTFDNSILVAAKVQIANDLKSSWKEIIKDISEEKKYWKVKSSLEWLEIVLESNVPFGKQNRATALICAYRQLVPHYTAAQTFKACVVAWCAEIMQTAFLMADDIMDFSKTRRGSPCWYLRVDKGSARSSALNDCFMLENLVYYLLKKYFGQASFYLRLFEVFQETTLQTTFGQCMDIAMTQSSNHLDRFNMESYTATVEYKTSYYTFYFPIAAAMIMAEVKEPLTFAALEEVALKMGFYFQVQDDYLDCFGNTAITGKIGTDIQSRKCTWLLVKALDLCSDAQRNLLEEYYLEEPTEENVESVKAIYLQLKIPELFMNFEKEQQDFIREMIEMLPKEVPKLPLHLYTSAIFGRTK